MVRCWLFWHFLRICIEFGTTFNNTKVENFSLHVVFQSKSAVPPEQGLSNGLIILVIAIVVGCFAVLWPK